MPPPQVLLSLQRRPDPHAASECSEPFWQCGSNTRATNIAAAVGQGLALLFGLAGLFETPMLLFIAFIVWMGASQEASMVQMKSA